MSSPCWGRLCVAHVHPKLETSWILQQNLGQVFPQNRNRPIMENFPKQETHPNGCFAGFASRTSEPTTSPAQSCSWLVFLRPTATQPTIRIYTVHERNLTGTSQRICSDRDPLCSGMVFNAKEICHKRPCNLENALDACGFRLFLLTFLEGYCALFLGSIGCRNSFFAARTQDTRKLPIFPTHPHPPPLIYLMQRILVAVDPPAKVFFLGI